MSTVNTHPRRVGVAVWLFMVLVALVGLFAPAVSAAAGVGPETRVRAFDHPAPVLVAVEQPGSSTTIGVSDPPLRQQASATGVATNSVGDILPKPVVSEPKLSNIVDDLYKGTTNPSRVGTGTTADAVRNEARTGLPTGGKFHTVKAEQYSNALRSVLKKSGLSDSDRLVAQSVLDELQAALGEGHEG